MIDCWRVRAIEEQRDQACGIRLKGKPRHIVHQADLLHVFAWIRWIHRRLLFHDWARPLLPLGRLNESLFEIPDACEILIQALPVPHADMLPKGDFTVEAFIYPRSVADTAAVRTIAGKWAGNLKEPGWGFAITGKGSRRKPQTLVMQLYGMQNDLAYLGDATASLRDEANARGAALVTGPSGQNLRDLRILLAE